MNTGAVSALKRFRPQDPLAALGLLLVAAEFAAGFRLAGAHYPVQDVSAHVDTALQMLQGKRLYQDLLTVQLPMVFLFRLPGAWLATAAGWNPFALAQVFDAGLALLSFLLTRALLRRFFLGQPRRAALLFDVFLGLALFILPAFGNFPGEKETLYFLFTLPYFALAAATALGADFARPLRLFIGVFAAVGFCYKPCTVLPLGLVTAALCWQERSWRPLARAEFAACVVTGLAYIALALALLPGYAQNILPFMPLYPLAGSARFDLGDFARRHLLPFIALGLAPAGYFLWIDRPQRRFYAVLLLAGLGYLLNGVVQMKPYQHHFYPFYALATILLALWGARRRERRGPALLTPALLLMFVLQLYILNPPLSDRQHKPVIARILAAAAPLPRPPRVMQMSYFLTPFFPYGPSAGLRRETRFDALWLLDGALQYKKRYGGISPAGDALAARAEALVLDTVTADLVRIAPDFVIFDERSTVNLIHYFLGQERFRAVFAPAYLPLEKVNTATIYVRRGLPRPPPGTGEP